MKNGTSEENIRLLMPESEFEFEAFRSSAPGGQNVNKTESAVRLRWRPESSQHLSLEQKTLIIDRLRNEKELRIRLRSRGIRMNYEFTREGDLLITSQDTRDQFQNKEHSKEKFYLLLEEALRPEPKRKPFSKPSPERRLEEKRRRAEQLRERQFRGE